MSASNLSKLEDCTLELHRIGAVKFGEFTLKSGIKSPIYFDLRIITSFPKILEMVADLLWEKIESKSFDHICGVPYTALPVASVISLKHNRPMLIRRKEMKSYGTKRLLEGVYSQGQSCLIVEDVVVSGSSVIETAQLLRQEKLKVSDVVVFLDREQGGINNLKDIDINLTSVLSIREMLKILQTHRKIDDVVLKNTMNYLDSNSDVSVPSSAGVLLKGCDRLYTPLLERAKGSPNHLSRHLLHLIAKKKSNLCVAVDTAKSEELLDLANKLGPYICVLKTHIDVVEDFTPETTRTLTELAKEHEFLIFEDRKFADIGAVVKMQYTGGVHRIADWAHLVTVHPIAGPGVLQGFLAAGPNEERGCVIIAEMSSSNNLITSNYTEESIKIGDQFKQFAIGYVSQSSVHSDPGVLLFTPGVSLDAADDPLGQKYVTPEKAVEERGADVIIVGRGITSHENPVERAKEYRDQSFAALVKRSDNKF